MAQRLTNYPAKRRKTRLPSVLPPNALNRSMAALSSYNPAGCG